jgi:hypothetical protein
MMWTLARRKTIHPKRRPAPASTVDTRLDKEAGRNPRRAFYHKRSPVTADIPWIPRKKVQNCKKLRKSG